MLITCLPSPSYVRPPRFPFYPSDYPPSVPTSLVGFPSTPLLLLPPLLPILFHCAPHPQRMRGAPHLNVPRPRATSPGTVRLPQGPPGIPLARLYAAVDHRVALSPNTEWGCARDPSVARNSVLRRSSTAMHLCHDPTGLGFSPPQPSSRTLRDWVIAPRTKERPFTDGRFDALSACLFGGLRV